MEQGKKFLFIYIGAWLLWSSFNVAVIIYFGFLPGLAVIDSFVSNGILALIGLALVNVLRYYSPGVSTSWNLALWCFLLSAFCLFAANTILKFIFSDNDEYLNFLHRSLAVRYFVYLLIIACVVMISWIRKNLISQKEEMVRKMDMEKINRETELNTLRQQMQPHFLFNSLNSIASLVKSNPDDARKMVHHLSDFMRYTLKKNLHNLLHLKKS